jgi:hypothetical protein
MTEEDKKNTVRQEAPADTTPITDGEGFALLKKEDITKTSDTFQKKPEMGEGEKKFEWWTYTGLNYWVNLISSVAVADYLLNPASSGRKKLDYVIEKGTLAVEKMGVSLKTSHHNSKVWLETLALTSGGWFLLVPMKWLEDHKRPIVHWLNDKLGVDQTAPDGHKKTPDEIHIEKEQPKQSWGEVIWRRFLATIAVTFTGLALDHSFKDKSISLPQEKYMVGGREIVYDAKVLGGKDRSTGAIVNFANKGLKLLKLGLG